MADLIQKQDLAASSFSNTNSLAAGGVTVRTNAGSAVGTAIAAAIAAIPNAGDVVRGLIQLAVAGNYPQHANNVDAATPAYVKAALDAAVAALPSDIFLSSLQSYSPATNVMTFLMSDGSTVPVDMTDLLSDAVATITTGKVSVFGNDGVTLLGYLLPV